MLLSTVVALLQMGAVVRTDGAKLQRDAQKAQARFETVRRSHLPWDRSGGSSGRCDATIGRYCYWYDSTQRPVVPEPPQIIDARNKLLAVLDVAAELEPAGEWIAGQRVRYLIEGGRAPDAVGAARRCRATPWWCAALEGLALHVDEQYEAADSAFTMALRAMPATQRCAWVDLRGLIGGGPLARELERELARASCDEREALANALWELGRPLWSVPGNDLRTEHLARQTMAAVLAKSENAQDITWSGDSREMVIRYGWSEWFTRHGSDIGGMYTTARVTGYDREPSYQFFPQVASVRQTPRLTHASWSLREPLARARYGPRYLKGLTELPHQLARFPRGDSMLLAVAYRVADTALARDSLVARLVIAGSGMRDAGSGKWEAKDAILAMAPNDTIIASIEVRGDSSDRAARARYTIDPLACADPWCLSDLLLFDASGAQVSAELDSVLPRAAAELRFSNRMPLGLFWETQGAGSEPVTVWVSLTVSPVRPSLARRVATRLGVMSERTPVRLRWQATLRANREGQLLTVQLPRNVRGTHRVLLTIEPPNAPPLSAVREVELIP